ncbi:hypothetical protein [Neisseria meningitidis]|uniref:hypothetical protein n=1 Tax=Neisseria meningitidis TaxID=487 RepID=UPI000A8A73A5
MKPVIPDNTAILKPAIPDNTAISKFVIPAQAGGNDVVQVSVWMDSSFPTTPQS